MPSAFVFNSKISLQESQVCETRGKVWSKEENLKGNHFAENLNKLNIPKSMWTDGLAPTGAGRASWDLTVSPIFIDKLTKYRLDKWIVRVIENWLGSWAQRVLIKAAEFSLMLITDGVSQQLWARCVLRCYGGS